MVATGSPTVIAEPGLRCQCAGASAPRNAEPVLDERHLLGLIAEFRGDLVADQIAAGDADQFGIEPADENAALRITGEGGGKLFHEPLQKRRLAGRWLSFSHRACFHMGGSVYSSPASLESHRILKFPV
jgi:hypothetical protein